MPGERQADIMKAKTEDRLQKGALHMRAITYSRQGDYLLPDLTIPDGPEVHRGKYASLRQKYLKEHRYGIYLNLLTMKAAWGVTEELKAKDQMMWVQQMSNIRQAAEEIVMRELIYS